jgi:cardiolipin synthase
LFVEEYLRDLRREHYRPDAVYRYISRCWQLARGEAAANPDAVRSVVFLGIVLFGITFLASVVMALTTDLTVARRILVWTGLWLIPICGALLLHIGLLRDREGYPLPAVNLATAVTIFRLAIVPALAITLLDGYWKTAFWLFIIGGLSDVIDGWIARRWNQVTRLGAIVDPIVDVFFHLTLFLSMYGAGLAGSWVAILAAIRYGGLLAGGIVLYVMRGPVKIQSTLPGKLSGLVIGVLIGFLLLVPSYGAGGLGNILTPLARDALIILLGGSIVHAAVMGWFNFRHAHLAAEQSRKVIRDVRFGEPKQ